MFDTQHLTVFNEQEDVKATSAQVSPGLELADTAKGSEVGFNV